MPRGSRIAALAVAAALTLTVSACGSEPTPLPNPNSSTSSSPAPSAPAAVGTPAGVVENAFQVGDGSVVVDLYTDASCPHCKLFDAAAADELQARVDAGEITLRLHPVNYVSAKRGDQTEFSTRAMNVLTVVSDHGYTDLVPAIYSAIVAEQPDTADGTMPDDDRLIALAEEAGVEIDATMRDEITNGSWAAWVQSVNDTTTASTLADGQQFSGVPTLLIDDESFEIREDGTDLERLQQVFAR